MSLKPPLPIEFEDAEDRAINLLVERSGLNKAAILRRSLRLLAREIEKRGRTWDWVAETGPVADRRTLEGRSLPLPKQKNKPVNTRLDSAEAMTADRLAKSNDLTKTNVIRRGVKLLAKESERRGPKWNWVNETAQPLPVPAHDAPMESAHMLKKILRDADSQRRGTGATKSARKSS